VVIPGFGTLLPERWIDNDGDIWLKSIHPESAPDAGIFAFSNELITDDGTFRWSQVEKQGATFLGALYSLIQDNDVCCCNIMRHPFDTDVVHL
jgi:hypothetical protein